VLLGWYWNDLKERPIQATYEQFLQTGEVAFDTGARMEGKTLLAWRALQLLRRSAGVMLLHDLVSTKGRTYPTEEIEQGFQRLERLLQHFREQGERLGARPVVVIFPDVHRLGGGGATRALDERTGILARARGLEVLEPLEALEPLARASGKPPILPFDGHYDARANEAMGAWLAERLLALGVPGSDG